MKREVVMKDGAASLKPKAYGSERDEKRVVDEAVERAVARIKIAIKARREAEISKMTSGA